MWALQGQGLGILPASCAPARCQHRLLSPWLLSHVLTSLLLDLPSVLHTVSQILDPGPPGLASRVCDTRSCMGPALRPCAGFSTLLSLF